MVRCHNLGADQHVSKTCSQQKHVSKKCSQQKHYIGQEQIGALSLAALVTPSKHQNNLPLAQLAHKARMYMVMLVNFTHLATAQSSELLYISVTCQSKRVDPGLHLRHAFQHHSFIGCALKLCRDTACEAGASLIQQVAAPAV